MPQKFNESGKKKVKISVKKLSPLAKLPGYQTPLSAGADLVAALEEEVTVAPGETKLIPTGLAFAIPAGYAGLIYARSGLASKEGLAPANKVGVVDADYRGEVMVALHNHSAASRTVLPGERIAQFVIAPVEQALFEEVPALPESERGAGGFGSTGKA